MINLTANFVAAFSVGKVVKYNITHLQDLDREAPAKPNYLVVQVSLFDTGSSPWPINPFTLYIYDAPHASQVLTINATPTGLNDQFIRQDVVLPGTPYTTLTAAMYRRGLCQRPSRERRRDAGAWLRRSGRIAHRATR
jgi:hypothetical protein